MNSYEIIGTPDAEADLYEIKNDIAETLLEPDVALNYIRVIRNEMEKLTYMADSIAMEEREPWHSRVWSGKVCKYFKAINCKLKQLKKIIIEKVIHSCA